MRFAALILALIAIAPPTAHAQQSPPDRASLCSAIGHLGGVAAKRRDFGDSLQDLLDEARRRTKGNAQEYAAARWAITYAFRYSYYTPQMTKAYLTGDCLKAAGY